MAVDDGVLTDIAGAILDGTPVDWEAAQTGADSAEAGLLSKLRVVSLVAELHRQMASPPGAAPEWGHLRLLEAIGAGAFGEVYRAWDTRLDREVALKLLPPGSASVDARATTIINEGRLLARVRHPNVVTIYGAERRGDRVGLWMEFVKGRTLEQLVRDGRRFSPAEAIDIGVQLSRAVAAVHDSGLLHRDIKAQNVMLADDGRVMLMDFGTGLDLTAVAETGLAGTPRYLAPELFAGGAATTASDVYSLGVLLYYLLTGRYPVGGESLHALRLAHERKERTALVEVAPDLPRRLTRAIEHAIDPQPDRRCQSAAALTVALRSAQRGSPRRWIGYAGLAAAAAVFTLWMGQTGQGDTGPNRSLADIARAPAASWWAGLWPAKRRVIAVLPFQNLGTLPDSDLMADGLTYQITSMLATVDGLDVLSAPSSFAFKGRPRDLAAIRTKLGADIVVEGELFASEDGVRVIANLVSVPENVTEWSATFDPQGKGILDIQRELTTAIVTHLTLKLGGGQRRYDIDPVLQMKFLTARALAVRHEPAFAIEAAGRFEEIVKQAPSYAPAWAALASALGTAVRLEPEYAPSLQPRMREAALEANRLDPLLAEANAAMGVVQAYDLHWNDAHESFAVALSRNRSLSWIHTDAVLMLLSPLNRLDEAMELLEVARNVDPLSLDVLRTLAHVQVDAGQYAEAIGTARLVLERDPAYPFADTSLGRALALSGRPDEALRIFEELPGSRRPAYLGYVYAVTGRRGEAEALAAKESSRPARQFLIYAGLGEKERAFEALGRTVEKNPWRAATWMFRPEFAFLRDDPRFDEFRRRLNLPGPGAAARR